MNDYETYVAYMLVDNWDVNSDKNFYDFSVSPPSRKRTHHDLCIDKASVSVHIKKQSKNFKECYLYLLKYLISL